MHITSYDAHYPATARVNSWQRQCIVGKRLPRLNAQEKWPRSESLMVSHLYIRQSVLCKEMDPAEDVVNNQSTLRDVHCAGYF